MTESEINITSEYRKRFRRSISEQPFLFRLWVGILMGVNLGFIMLAINVLTNSNETIRSALPMGQGITFIVLGIIDIFFMIKLLQFMRYGLYGTLLMGLINMILNLYWGANVLWPLALCIVSATITLIFVVPKWRIYE